MRKIRGIGRLACLVVVVGCLSQASWVIGEELAVPDSQSFSQTRWGMPGGLSNGHPNFESECGFLVHRNGKNGGDHPESGGGASSGEPYVSGKGPNPGKIFLLHLIQKFGIAVPPCP
jgi:hypothetical protein